MKTALSLSFPVPEKKYQSWRHYVRRQFIKLWRVKVVERRIDAQLCVMKLTSRGFPPGVSKEAKVEMEEHRDNLFTRSAHIRARVLQQTQYLEEISSPCVLYMQITWMERNGGGSWLKAVDKKWRKPTLQSKRSKEQKIHMVINVPIGSL